MEEHVSAVPVFGESMKKETVQAMKNHAFTISSAKRRELIRLTVPIFCEAALFTLIGSLDTVMLSQYSDNAVGAVGVANQVLFLFRVITNIVTAGTGILCAHYVGSGKSTPEKQPLVLGALLVNSLIGIAFSVAILLGADLILAAMNVSQELYIHGKDYLTIVGSFLFVQTVAMTFTSLIRSHGKTKATMVFSLLMNLCNLVLNYILIYGRLGLPRMGAAGAATATVISTCFSTALSGWYLFRKVLPDLTWQADWGATRQAVRKILALGGPAAGEQISYTLSNLVIMVMVTSLGTTAVNTYSYVNTITRFVYLLSMALGQGAAILIGWEIGKKQLSEATAICNVSVRYSFLFSMGAIALLSLLRESALGLFTEDPGIIAMGSAIILSDFLLEAGRSRNLVLVNALRAAGDVHFPLQIGLFSMWFFSVGFSWLLGLHMELGLIGVWLALGLDECFRAVGMQLRWKKGTWSRYAEKST